MPLDYRIFEFFNAWAGRSSVIDGVIIFFAQYFIWLVYLGLLLWWFLSRNRFEVRQRLILIFISVVLGRIVLVEIIRFLYHRARPFLVYDVVQLIHPVLLLGRDNDGSFPSGHAAIVFGIAASIYFYNKKIAVWLMFFGLIIGLSRVIAGIHYLSDILGGAVVGIVSAWLIEKLFRRRTEALSRKLSDLSDRILAFTQR